MLTGIRVTTDELVGLRRPPGQSRAVQSFARQVGQRESHLAGTGLQMREVRHYQTGDDLRHIHWKATAKAGEPLTRVFDAEHELSWLLVILLTPEMYFGSQSAFKSVRALEAAAQLAWDRLGLNDAVGSVIASPHGLDMFTPSRTRQGLLQQLSAWSRHSHYPDNPEWPEDGFETVLNELPRVSQPHRPMVIFSDFLPPFGWERLIAQCARYPTTLVQLYDPLEVDVPAHGAYPIAGRNGVSWVQGSKRATRRHAEARSHWFEALYRQCSQGRTRWVTLGTEQDPDIWSWLTQEVHLGHR